MDMTSPSGHGWFPATGDLSENINLFEHTISSSQKMPIVFLGTPLEWNAKNLHATFKLWSRYASEATPATASFKIADLC